MDVLCDRHDGFHCCGMDGMPSDMCSSITLYGAGRGLVKLYIDGIVKQDPSLGRTVFMR